MSEKTDPPEDDEPMTEAEYAEVVSEAIDDIAAIAPVHDPIQLQRFLGWLNELLVRRAFEMPYEDQEPDA